mgnify:FL=1
MLDNYADDLAKKLKKLQEFKITYFAKKHGEYITRRGVWQDDKCKLEYRNGGLSFTYWDIDKQAYRMANDIKEILGNFPQELENKVRQWSKLYF